MHTFLLEVGMEELPAQYILGAQTQLKEKVESFLQEARLQYQEVQAYSTPRRLAVVVEGLADSQESIEVEAKGPAMKIAKDADGNWTKAAIGFARGQGLAVEDLFVKEFNGVEYAYGIKKEEARQAKDVLTGLDTVVKSLTFPKSMRWSDLDFKYIRPIHWLVALLDDVVIPFEVATVKTNRFTFGHRFLGGKIKLANAKEYSAVLKAERVIVSYEERKQLVVEQIAVLEKENQWHIPLDADLLEEVTNLVEWPTALYGSFQESFLRVPTDVLITSMKEHQRYFPVFDGKNPDELKPYFITVRNGDKEHIEMVRKGNEKVLTARLSDAAFFFDEDLKKSISSCTDRLQNIVFHVDLGSLAQKVSRIEESAKFFAGQIAYQGNQAFISRAAEICKFDLVTNMVYEFPELQGRMGEVYTLAKGEPKEVATAINEHYMPRNAEDSVPTTELGAILSVADKLDTIVGFFTIGKIPSGSADPHGLRRQTAGIIQMMIEKDWNISLEPMIDYIFGQYEKEGFTQSSLEETKQSMVQFVSTRFKTVLQEMNLRFDVIEAVLAQDILNIRNAVLCAKALNAIVLNSENKPLLEALNRTVHIAKDAVAGNVDEGLFQLEEKVLFEAASTINEAYQGAIVSGDFAEAFRLLQGLQKPIESYFEHIMVYCEDKQVQENRLTMLANIRINILKIGNVSLLNLK